MKKEICLKAIDSRPFGLVRAVLLALIASIPSPLAMAQEEDNPGWLQQTISPEEAAASLDEDPLELSVTIPEVPPFTPLTDDEAAASLGQAVPTEPLLPPGGGGGSEIGGDGGEGGSEAPPPPPGNEADEITPEIAQLARGLRKDPVKIFEYVHNFIRFEAYYGSKKGAHLTLLEGSGNEYDQCALLVALLRSAGQTAEYRYGPCVFTFAQLCKWYGISSAPYSHWTDAEMRTHYGKSSPFPTDADRRKLSIFEFLTNRGYPYKPSVDGTNGNQFVIPHVWVVSGGKVLSPSWKDQTVRAGIGLATAVGYSRSQILDDAGGDVGGMYVKNIDYQALSNRLKAYTQNFIGSVRASQDGRLPDRITKSSSIDMESYTNLNSGATGGVRAIVPRSISGLPSGQWSAIPVSEMSKLEIRAGVWSGSSWTSTWSNQTLNLPGLKGRKLSLTYSGNTASIHLDDSLLDEFNIPAAKTSFDLKLGVTHNHRMLIKSSGVWINDPAWSHKTDQSETKQYLKGNNCAYALIYSFANPERLSRARQEKLEKYRRDGKTDADWEVKTETLNIIGLNWFSQLYQAGEIIGGQYDIVPLNHHRFGRVGQDNFFDTNNVGFYIDVGLMLGADSHRARNPASLLNYEYLLTTFASAMEHGVLEQMQGKDITAASTVKMIFLANDRGQKIYRATRENFEDLTYTLADDNSGYPQGVLNRIASALDKSGDSAVLLPANGQLSYNAYTGFAYALEEPAQITMKIGSNYGGYSSVETPAGSNEILDYFRSHSAYLDSSSDLVVPATSPAISRNTFGDPVDVASGAWIDQKTDLVFPGEGSRGITFTRYYNSNAAADDGPGLGYGWTHSLDITATRRSNAQAGLGATNTYQAAPFFAALAVASDLLEDQTTAKVWTTGVLAIHWAVNQLAYKTVSIKMGNQTMEFVRMPDGTFIPPAGMNLTLDEDGDHFKLTARNGPTMTFRPDGKIANITDLFGNSQTFTYVSGNLTKVKDCYNREFNFTWTGGRITAVSDSTSRTVEFGYDNGNLQSVTDVEGKTSTYHYDGLHRVDWAKDAESRMIIENEYDPKGRVIVQRNRGDAERTYRIFYTGYCNVEVDPVGGEKAYYYDSRGRTIGTKNATGNSDKTEYDGQDRVITQISPKTEIVRRTYNSDNNVTSEKDEKNIFTYYDYDSNKRLKSVKDRRGHFTYYEYFPKHQIKKITDPLEHETTFTYRSDGLLETVTDPENYVTTTGYNSKGYPNSITLDHGTDPVVVKTMTYSTRGDLLTMTDAEERTTTNTYNNRGQLETVTLPPIAGEPPAVTTNAYDDCGNLKSTTDARLKETTYTYNALRNPRVTTFPALPSGTDTITTGYDLRDWPVSLKNSAGYEVTTEYDAARRPKKVTNQLEKTTETLYDANGRPVQVKDPLTHLVKMEWTERGEKKRTIDSLSKNTDSEYDANGNLWKLKNRRLKTYEFGYDDANRPTFTKRPSTKTSSTGYFDNDLVKTRVEPSGQTTTLAYNGKKLVETRTDPEGAITYEYDDSGLPEVVTEGTTVITRAYDERGRLKTFTTADGDSIGYKYDPVGNLIRLTYPPDTAHPAGKQVNYTYNARNLLETVTDWRSQTTTYVYDSLARLKEVQRPNGTVLKISRDKAGQILGLKESAGGKLFNYQGFAFDAVGKIVRKLQAPLVSSGTTQPSFTGTYDDDDRLASVNGTPVTHDDDGNMTLGPVSPTSGFDTLSYNSRNQLTHAGDLTYTYDAEGRRRTIADAGTPGGITRDVIDSSGKLLVRHHPDGTLTRYVYGLGLLYEVDEADHAKTYHFDQVGSTIARTDDTGQVIGRAAYSAYGLLLWKQGDLETPFLYNGQAGVQTDSNGLLNMRARYYSPYLMRFLNADPSGFSGGSNWFAYANGNPVSLSDPFGLCAERNACTGGYSDWSGFPAVPDWMSEALKDTHAEIGRMWNDIEGGALGPNPEAMFVGVGQASSFLFSKAGTILNAADDVAAAANTGVQVEQYALRAADSGFYPVLTRTFENATEITWLERGDVWKFGTTKNPATRYSQSYLDNIGDHGVLYQTEWQGTIGEALQLEKMKIQNFQLQNGGILPAGNKIVR